MKTARTFIYNQNQSLESNIRRLEQDTHQLFEALKGRIRFGSGVDGERGENVAGEFQVIADTGNADTEITLAHTIGAVPIGYIVIKIDKAGIIYDSGTTWTSSNIYLKCDVANCAVSLFLIK
jgi:hypothetical protein